MTHTILNAIAYLHAYEPEVFAVLLACLLWGFWGLFVLIMGLYRAFLNKRLGTASRILGAPFLLAGASLDVLCNMTLASLLFLEAPHEWTVSQRFSRYISSDSGWRKDVASWVCNNLLDPFDPTGKHC